MVHIDPPPPPCATGVVLFRMPHLADSGASPTQENVKGKTAIDLASSEMTFTLLCPLHYCAARGMLDNLVSEVAKVL